MPVCGRPRPPTLLALRLARSFLYLLAWIFLVLVVIGNVSNHAVLRETYFIKIDVSNIVPISVSNAVLVNSVARSLGLHDFYQVGLWNYCEGYDDTGVTHCAGTRALYYFDPVEIIKGELLAGATISLPGDINDALKIAKTASHWMFGFFITAVVLVFILIFISPFAASSRPPQRSPPDTQEYKDYPPHRRGPFILFRSLPFTVLTFFTALFTIVASIIATVMFSIFKHVFGTNGANLNIKANLGARMFAFMWIASACTFLAFLLELGSFCAVCCWCCCGGRKHRHRKQARREMEEREGKGHASPESQDTQDSNISKEEHSPHS